MDKRNRVNDSVTNFTNQGYLQESMGESRFHKPANLSNVNGCAGDDVHATNHRVAHDIESDQNSRRIISNGIRELAEEDRMLQTQNNKPKASNCYSRSIASLVILLVLAPIGVSAYVFLKHQEMVNTPCAIGPSISPSMQQSNSEYMQLKNLVTELKELQKDYQELHTKLNSGDKSSKGSLRDERRKRMNATKNDNAYQASLDELKATFSGKANQIGNSCRMQVKKVEEKVKDIEKRLDEEKNSCVFKVGNNTVMDDARSIQKAQLIETKNAAIQLVGVTCCSQYYTSNVTTAILEVEETSGNVTYACFCAVGTTCSICYWQCGNT